MRRRGRRLFLLVVALAPAACSTYGRDETTIVEVHATRAPRGPARSNGATSGNTSSDWSSVGGIGTGSTGTTTATDATWTNAGTQPCAQLYHLYWFTQP